MSPIGFFFGFYGRVARGRFWIFGLTIYVLAAAALALDPVMFDVMSNLTAIPILLVLMLYLFLGMSSVSVVAIGIAVDTVMVQELPASLGLTILVGSVVIGLLLSWVVVAVASKRLHDRNKSGWWLLVFIATPLLVGGLGALARSNILLAVAFAFHLWSFIELGCRRGTVGGNRFGPDPLLGGETDT
ncbi:MAG TPA: DUF805 domain-containing protein [Stellaceae bacterium]|nr:DUF805 domain-containing protein [Stellaceae bacterium]